MAPFITQLFYSRSKSTIPIPFVKIHNVETEAEKSGRTLKYFLRLNHANHAIWSHSGRYNSLPSVLISAYLLGANHNELQQIYDAQSKTLEPWTASPHEVTGDDWRDYMGNKEYQRAYLDLFEDKLVDDGYDWKATLSRFLFTGKEPLFHSITAGLGYPLIHLAYAYEVSSPVIATEALAHVAVCYSDVRKYSEDVSYAKAEPLYRSDSTMSILEKIRSDKRLDNVLIRGGQLNLQAISRDHEATILEHWNAWTITDPVKQFQESQMTAIALFAGAKSGKYGRCFFQVLATSHALRVVLPLIPSEYHMPLLRQWWLLTVSLYISEFRPEIDMEEVKDYDAMGRDWNWAVQKALREPHSTNPLFVQGIYALRSIAHTWGDRDELCQKAAIKFADEFEG